MTYKQKSVLALNPLTMSFSGATILAKTKEREARYPDLIFSVLRSTDRLTKGQRGVTEKGEEVHRETKSLFQCEEGANRKGSA